MRASPAEIPIFVAGRALGDAFGFNYMKLPPYRPTGISAKPVAAATLTEAEQNHI